MAGNPLEQMMQLVAQEAIASGYPHLQYPAIMTAKVTKAAPMTGYGLYNLKVLDADGEINADYPELPDVHSQLGLETGDVVVIALIRGQLQPYIIGEVV